MKTRTRFVNVTVQQLRDLDEACNDDPEALAFLRRLQEKTMGHEDSRTTIRKLASRLNIHRDILAAYIWLQSCILEAMQTGEGVEPEIMTQSMGMAESELPALLDYIQGRYQYFEQINGRDQTFQWDGRISPVDLLEEAGRGGMAHGG